MEITLRHLVSHLSGIRHYEKVSSSSKQDEGSVNDEDSNKAQKNESEFKNKEYLLNTYYESVSKSLSLFKDDELFSKPGNNSNLLVWLFCFINFIALH